MKRRRIDPKQARRLQREKLEAVADRIISAFADGRVPAAAAQVFLTPDERFPSAGWSLRNRFLVALAGASCAAGFKQWKALGRSVKKGEKAFAILQPCVVKATSKERETSEGDDEDRTLLLGFKAGPVFGLHQTEGDAIQPPHAETLEALPLLEVAREWGINVRTMGANPKFLGRYSTRAGGVEFITLAVENLATWAHEMVHAADARCVGGLMPGQHQDQEIVAELGGAVLLECIGRPDDADCGGAWNYVQAQVGQIADPDERRRATLELCHALLDRTLAAVALILETAAGVDAAALDGATVFERVRPDSRCREGQTSNMTPDALSGPVPPVEA